jgi:hypothetical protein
MLALIHRRTSAKTEDLQRLADLLRGARRSIGPASLPEQAPQRA